MSNVRTVPSTLPPIISVFVKTTDMTESKNVSMIWTNINTKTIKNEKQLTFSSKVIKDLELHNHQTKGARTWTGSTLWDLQSHTRSERSKPADTTTADESLNFTAFTCQDKILFINPNKRHRFQVFWDIYLPLHRDHGIYGLRVRLIHPSNKLADHHHMNKTWHCLCDQNHWNLVNKHICQISNLLDISETQTPKDLRFDLIQLFTTQFKLLKNKTHTYTQNIQ